MARPSEYTLPYFGELDLTDLDDYYDVEIDLDGENVQLDLNFDGRVAKVERLDAVKSFIENLAQQDVRNKEYIRTDYEDAEADSVKFYLNFHLEEVGEEELARLLGVEDNSLPVEEQLLDKLNLVRMGFYPDEEGYFAICDYSFGKELTNYLIVLVLNARGELLDITVES